MRRKTVTKILLIILIPIFLISAAVVYLNQVIIPQKIKSLIVSALEKQTGKDVDIDSIEFNPFSGLVIRGLVVTDNENVLLSTRQANCSFFIWPIFKKQIIIPSLTLKTPYIYLERREDNTFNLQSLFNNAPKPQKTDFAVSVLKINVVNGTAAFQDNTFDPHLRKEIKNIQLNLYLSLPASVRFNLRGEIISNPLVTVAANGQYKILEQELVCNLGVRNLSTQEFKAYYSDYGDIVSGLVELNAQVNLKDQLLKAEIKAEGEGLVAKKDELKAKFSPEIKTNIEYDLVTNRFNFKGSCNILQADISGIPTIGEIKNLKGNFAFTDRSLISENLKAELLGKQFEVKLGVKDFATPILSIDTELELFNLTNILKDKFNLGFIETATGEASLNIKANPDKQDNWVLHGSMVVKGASLKIDKHDWPVENIFGKLGFSLNGLSWEEAKFTYQGKDYQSNGSLDNFNAPSIKMSLESNGLLVSGNLNLNDQVVEINPLKGKYLNSQFTVRGYIDTKEGANFKSDLTGKVNLTISDLNQMLDKQFPDLKVLKLGGQLDGQFDLNGNLNDPKSCYLKANIKSETFSLYGFNIQRLSLDLFLDQKIAKISSLSGVFYEGLLEGSGSVNVERSFYPFEFELKANAVKLDKLKMDTASKDKDISGTLTGNLEVSGVSDDIGKLKGTGKFGITEGKLWELNLLEGIGKLLFSKDLNNINISECSAEFWIKDKYVATENLKLKSNVANLEGPMKIGFDQSLEGSLKVDIISDMVPVSGTLKDLTTALVGEAGIFGTIRLGGTIQNPKHNFKPAVGNLIKGLTDVFFGNKDKE